MKLKDYIEKHGVNQTQFAAKIGVSREQVWKWAEGRNRPQFKHVKKIEAITKGKIKWRDWE